MAACVVAAAACWPVALPAQEETPPPAALQAEDAEAPAEMTPEEAEKRFFEEVEKFGWTREGKGPLGAWAEIAVPGGYRLTNGDGARQLLQMYGNLVGSREQGLIAPENLDWFIVFDFEEVGYVKDDDKDKLDADAILKQKKEVEIAANQRKKEMGLPALYIQGWTVKPHYDEKTHNLEWGLLLQTEDGSQSVNYNMKLLGRNGVMDATLVCDPAVLEATLPEARRLISGFSYQSGQTYAEYRKGDKIAEYGLTGLVLGGGAVLAAKSGLFATLAKFFGKFFKFIIVGVVALGLGIKKLFKGKSDPYDRGAPPPPAA